MMNWMASAMTRALTISLLASNERTAEIAIFASIGLTCAWPDFDRLPGLVFISAVMTFAGARTGQLFPIQRSGGACA
jgi:hypothetical protein